MADKDTNPYYLRNVDLDKLDLSSYAKDYSPEELDAVKASLREVQSQHHAAYEALPLSDKAQIYASEKFGDFQKYAEQNPEIAYGAPAAAVGGAAIVGAQKLFGSLRDKISSITNSTAAPLPDDAILAKQIPEKPVVSAAPSTPAPVSQETPPAAVKGVDKTPDQIRREKLAQAQAQLDGRITAPQPTAPAPTPSAQTLTPTQLVESAQPSSIPEGMTPETDVGKIPKDMGLVEKGTGNTVINAADKKVIEAEKALAKQGAIVPKGMKPDYLKPKGGIGVGPYHWFENQVGVERAPSLWRELFGEKNVPLKDVQEKYKAFAQSVPEGYTPRSDEGVLSKRGGNFGKTSAVPEYIRGSSSIEGMARTGLAALGILPVAQKLKQGDFKGALNEAIPASALIDPRLSLALSPLYTSEEEIATLKKAEQGRKVGAGRGIAPPSAYQR
ncbi:hypothetical protein [Caudoviricetes sp.]|nr:hypothetical protein [Caudoviricetes sp.]